MDSSSSSHSHLIGSYCTAHGLQSAAVKNYNGLDCYVVKVDPENPERFAVVFSCEFGVSDAEYKSLKPANLTLKYGLVIKPSCVPAIRGEGVFATRAYRRGEIIIAEKPILAVKDYDQNFHKLQLVNDRLTEIEKDIVFSFSTDGVELRGGNQLASIFGNNGIADDDGFSGLYPVICRINHCCWLGRHQSGNDVAAAAPSCNVWWYASSYTNPRALAALRDISAGEELFADYTETTLNPFQRRMRLSRYGIRGCECPICVPSPAVVSLIDEYESNLAALRQLNPFDQPPSADGPPYTIIETRVQQAASRARAAGEALVSEIVKISPDFANKITATMNSNIHGPIVKAHCEAIRLVLQSAVVQSAASVAEVEAYFQTFKAALHERSNSDLNDSCGGNDAHPYFLEKKTIAINDTLILSGWIAQLKRTGRR